MESTPENLHDRFIRVSREQKCTLVVCADDFRYDPEGNYGHEGDMGIIGWRMAERVFTELLPTVDEVRALAGAPGAGKSTWLREHGVQGVLYLDAMLARRLTRRLVCEMAAAAGREVDCIWLDTDLETCLSRNAARASDRVVPEEYVRAAHHRLSVCPPDLDEGWRRVVRVGSDPMDLGAAQGDPLDRSGRPL
jgi:predicted kinase